MLGACVMMLMLSNRHALPLVVAFTVASLPYLLYMGAMGIWSYLGREMITAERGTLLVEKRVLGVAASHRTYAADRISQFRVRGCGSLARTLSSPFSIGRQLGFGDGPITFEYEGTDVRIAEALRNDPVAAEELAERLRVGLHLDA